MNDKTTDDFFVDESRQNGKPEQFKSETYDDYVYTGT